MALLMQGSPRNFQVLSHRLSVGEANRNRGRERLFEEREVGELIGIDVRHRGDAVLAGGKVVEDEVAVRGGARELHAARSALHNARSRERPLRSISAATEPAGAWNFPSNTVWCRFDIVSITSVAWLVPIAKTVGHVPGPIVADCSRHGPGDVVDPRSGRSPGKRPVTSNVPSGRTSDALLLVMPIVVPLETKLYDGRSAGPLPVSR
jgi:hypothetical protein